MTAPPHAMCRRRLDAWVRCSLVVCGMLVVALPTLLVAQDVTASQLKAAFIYNFVKFTEWPIVLPASDPFVICVIGDPAVGDALVGVIEGRKVGGHPITALVTISRPTAACRVVYVSGATAAEVGRTITGLRDSPVLTISDVGGFTQTGGMAQFFYDHGRLRFTIKPESVKRSGLKMSARLLILGRP